ncbi:hypothetical protein D3C72_1455190 [compost metagenome]
MTDPPQPLQETPDERPDFHLAPDAGASSARRSRSPDRRAEGALRRQLFHGDGGAHAARARRVVVRRTAARGRGVRRKHAGCCRCREARERAQRAGHSLRRGLFARRPPARGARRHQHRRVAHEPGAVDQRRRPHGDGAAGRHAQAAQRRDQEHGPVLPHRPGRRRLHRRHDGHARQRHERGALRHDARERAGARSGHGQRRHHPHRHARQEVVGRLRPHAPHGGQ